MFSTVAKVAGLQVGKCSKSRTSSFERRSRARANFTFFPGAPPRLILQRPKKPFRTGPFDSSEGPISADGKPTRVRLDGMVAGTISRAKAGLIEEARVRTRYSPGSRLLRRFARFFRPIPKSPDYLNEADICAVRLVPEVALTETYSRAIKELGASVGDGAYVEFGVFNGTSLACMASAAASAGIPSFPMIGIDSFKGLPSGVAREDGGVWRPGQFACSRAETLRCLSARQVSVTSYSLLDGWYDEIDPEELAARLEGRNIAILMVDCDAYSSAKRALELIGPHLAPRAIIFFDDWRLNDLDLKDGGEYRAFNEWLESSPQVIVESFSRYSRKSEAFILTSTPG